MMIDALTIGTLLAWVVERTDTPFTNLAYLSACTSFSIPGIVKDTVESCSLFPRRVLSMFG
jgi:ABC-type Fe3+ transport system permease subunit